MKVYHFAVYDLATGAVKRAGSSNNRRARVLERRNLAPNEAIYCGEIDPATTYLPNGKPTPKPIEHKPVSITQVKAHAGRLLSYTDWYVTRRADTGDAIPSSIESYRASVRQASGAIELLKSIPGDFQDPKYWPAIP